MTGVLVLGALHHDVVVDAPALPRPDETLPGTAVDYRFGGKGGNQAIAAARMGARVSMAGRVGPDGAGKALLAALDTASVDRRSVLQGTRPTGMSVAICLPGGDYAAVIVSGANIENDGVVLPSQTSTVAVIQNEIPEVANLRFVQALPEEARLIWNAAPARPLVDAIAERTDLLVVNRVEAADLTGTADARKAADTLRERIRGEVIVTLGADGALLTGPDDCVHEAAPAVTAISTHGAGDMFVGAIAARLAAGEPVATGLRFAQGAAALFVSCAIADRGALTRGAVEGFLG